MISPSGKHDLGGHWECLPGRRTHCTEMLDGWGSDEGDSRGPGLHTDMNPRRPDHMSDVDLGGVGPNLTIFI